MHTCHLVVYKSRGRNVYWVESLTLSDSTSWSLITWHKQRTKEGQLRMLYQLYITGVWCFSTNIIIFHTGTFISVSEHTVNQTKHTERIRAIGLFLILSCISQREMTVAHVRVDTYIFKGKSYCGGRRGTRVACS